MSFQRVEDTLNKPESIGPKHLCNFGSPHVKLEGLIVALGMNVDFNTVVKQGLQLIVRDFKRKNKAKYDALMKQYGGVLGKKKG